MKKTILAGIICSLFVACGIHTMTKNKTRSSNYPVLPIILERWSPRAMSGEDISDKELMTIMEAGRWAPSSFNDQPWRFIYGKKGTEAWNTLFDVLVPFNQSWCARGAALVMIISRKNFAHNGEYSRTHSFDAGAAWENMALQAASMNLVCHGMSGFDYDKARLVCNIPQGYEIEAMFVIGKPGDVSRLPDYLQSKEEPSTREPLEKLVNEGAFKQ